MSKSVIRVIPFGGYDIPGLEGWLAALAAKGLRFSMTAGPLACFDRVQPEQVQVHLEPIQGKADDDPELNALKKRTQAILKARDPRLDLHDFRMTQGKRHVNVLFDVSLPSDLRGETDSILSEISQALNDGQGPQYHVKITFDSASFNQKVD